MSTRCVADKAPSAISFWSGVADDFMAYLLTKEVDGLDFDADVAYVMGKDGAVYEKCRSVSRQAKLCADTCEFRSRHFKVANLGPVAKGC